MGLLNRRNLIVSGTALTVGGVAAFGLSACKPKGGAVEAEDMTLGNPQAPVTMIEYASVACPHCARFNNNVWPAFKAKYVDTGKVFYISREMLTGQAAVAAAGFLMARCAGKDKYFGVTDQIYHSQEEIFADGTMANARAVLLRIGQSAGLSEADFDKCTRDTKALDAIAARSAKYGTRDKIDGTPSFVMNGKLVASGEVTIEQLDKAVAEAMPKK